MKKTKYDSYCINGIAKGCKYCVKGKKLVLFVTGICSRNCWYCSLSKKRKNCKDVYANERLVKNFDDILDEIKESHATSAGITGGDPLINFEKTIEFASKLKKHFGKKFHIHIYLPTRFVTKEKLEKLSKCVDEVRFHPDFLIDAKKIEEDLEKIKLASFFWKRKNIGIELPMIPEKKEKILEFVLKTKNYISFVNLNEFEISETNFKRVTKNYKLDEGGYVIKKSVDAGKWVLEKLQDKISRLKVHLCTAELKNCSQFVNRLKRHEVLPYGKRTKEGNVIYLITEGKLNLPDTFYDEKKDRTILSEKVARKLLKENKKVFRVEEFPTYDAIEIEKEEIN
jgi:hypothetical protein